MSTAPSLAAACAFPLAQGYRGAGTTIADLSRWGVPRNVWICSPRDAVHLLVEANLAIGNAHGKGNKARKRGERIEAEEMAAWWDQQRLTPDDIDEFYRQEMRRDSRAYEVQDEAFHDIHP